MKNDKQKVMILAALGVVMVGVGAFSFMGGGGEPAPAPTAKKEPKAENTSEVTTTEPGSSSNAEGSTNPGTTPTTPQIDPKTGMPVPATGTDPNGNPAASGENAVSVLVDPEAVAVAQLPQRDPFNGVRWDPMEAVKPVSAPVSQPNLNRGPRTPVRRPTSMGSGPGWNPLQVDPGNLSQIGSGGQVGTSNPGMPSIEEVPYKVNGLVTGRNSAVIVTDGSGKQRIARVGSKLDPDTEVLGVEDGKMVVRYRGKVKKVSIDDSGAAQKGGTKPPQNQ